MKKNWLGGLLLGVSVVLLMACAPPKATPTLVCEPSTLSFTGQEAIDETRIFRLAGGWHKFEMTREGEGDFLFSLNVLDPANPHVTTLYRGTGKWSGSKRLYLEKGFFGVTIDQSDSARWVVDVVTECP